MIKGLTDRGPMFPEIGVLRKGAKKEDPKKPGKDLTYFRFDTQDQNALRLFQTAFGKEPREIEIRLPFATTDENFEAWNEEYGAGGLKHRCNGVDCVLWQKPDGTYSTDPKKCPGGCKQTGRLKVIIPALERFAYVTVTTTSKWDIMTIHQNLMALELMRGSLRGIPMVLCRRQREISTPPDNAKEGAKRARRRKWLLAVEAMPEWVKLELQAQKQAALPGINEPLMLKPGEVDEEEDDEELDPAETGEAFTEEEPGEDVGEEEPGEGMITDDQHAALKAIIAQLRLHGFTNEKLADDLGKLSNGRAAVTSELTFEEAAKAIQQWQAVLKEKKAEAELKKRATV